MSRTGRCRRAPSQIAGSRRRSRAWWRWRAGQRSCRARLGDAAGPVIVVFVEHARGGVQSDAQVGAVESAASHRRGLGLQYGLGGVVTVGPIKRVRVPVVVRRVFRVGRDAFADVVGEDRVGAQVRPGFDGFRLPVVVAVDQRAGRIGVGVGVNAADGGRNHLPIGVVIVIRAGIGDELRVAERGRIGRVQTALVRWVLDILELLRSKGQFQAMHAVAIGIVAVIVGVVGRPLPGRVNRVPVLVDGRLEVAQGAIGRVGQPVIIPVRHQ